MSDPDRDQETKVSRWEALLPRFSLQRRTTVMVLLASTLVVGAIATFGIPLEMFPSGFTASFMSVDVPWQDAPAREVMDKVVLPLEEELSTVRGVARITSTARQGRGTVAMAFKQGTDLKVAYREVRDRVQRARARMPEDADRSFIRKHDLGGFPVAFVGLAIDPELTDIYGLVQNDVILRLERIEGVAQAAANGLEQKEILIELDRAKTEGAGLNIYELGQELSGDNFSLASGNVYSGGKKLLLRSVARYGSLEAIEERMVAPGVRVKDIARVSYEEPEKEFFIRVNSRPAVGINVLKEGDANTLEVARRINEEVDRMQEDPRLAGVEIDVLMDQGNVVMESLGTLTDSGRIGVFFAMGVLFFFLRRFRMTLIIALSIPLSMVIALTVMYFAGESLNILTLLGLMICVGLLVDNSVVVAENIYRLHRRGASRRDAVIKGAGEIALAIVTATLTTVAVFLPVSLVEGQGQFFLLRLAVPISVSLLASLVVALVFVPLSVYLTLSPRSNGDTRVRRIARRSHAWADRILSGAYEATLGRVNRGYTRVLAKFLAPRRWVDLTLVLLVLFAASIGLIQADVVSFTAADEEERGGFEIDVEMPETATLEETVAYFADVERTLEELQSELGLEGYFFWHGRTFGEVQGWFETPRPAGVSPRAAAERVLAAIPERAGVELTTGDEAQSDEDKESIHTVLLHGEDYEELERIAGDIEGLFADLPGVLAIKKEGQESMSELALVVDRERARQQKINAETIAGVVGYALRGQQLPRYYTEGREIPVRVRFEEEDRESLADLADFAVPTESGESVTLSSVTDVTFLPGTRRIQRRNKRIARAITLELMEGEEETAREGITGLQRRIDLPEGVAFGRPNNVNQDMEDRKSMGFAALLSVVFIYLLMAFLFESLVLPISIILTIPLAMIGVVSSHWIAGKSIDFLGIVGLILLIGVVVNNGIVLIDYVNRLRERGIARTEAILQAAQHRFRPIMMTALTTICGMFPLTLGGANSIGMSYKSFGLTLIGGLTSATFLTLLVVPVAYAVFDDVRELGGRAIRSLLSRRSTTVSTATSQ